MKNPGIILLATAVLAGCTSGPAWKRQLYAFSLPADPPATHAPAGLVTLNRVAISPLFHSRSFTYRTAENTYEQDPYAGFLIPPERALAEAIRAWMRASGAFGRVVDPGSSLIPSMIAEVSVHELYGDFREAFQPVGVMELRFLFFELKDGNPGRLVLDKVVTRRMPLNGRTPDALMTAWDIDLREIMREIQSEYDKATQRE
jgi:hypothetical protein